jgi:hypothetical protein
MRGGKKISKIPRGSISAVDSIDYPMTPSSSENLPSSILTTNRVGVYGMKGTIFCNCFMTIAIVREKNKKSKIRASAVM